MLMRIGYAWVRAVGIVNDHHVRCFNHTDG
jgi:hypothetical protein